MSTWLYGHTVASARILGKKFLERAYRVAWVVCPGCKFKHRIDSKETAKVFCACGARVIVA